MKKIMLLLLVSFFSEMILAQEYFPKNDGVHQVNQNYTAFINAKIFITPTEIIENGTLLIQNKKIMAVGSQVKIPNNTNIVDLKGKYIYPSFIDMYTDFGIEKQRAQRNFFTSAQYESKKEGYYWNEHVKPEFNAFETFIYDEKKAEEYLQAGFGVVGTHLQDGVARGTGLLVALNNFDNNNTRFLSSKISQHFGFTRSTNSQQSYPSSLMGMIALLKQFYHDANWYKNGNASVKDIALEALLANQNLVQIFDAGDKFNSLRADKIANEFGLNYILKGSGNEFESIQEIKNTKASFIIPVNFSDAYDVADPFLTNQLELSDLRNWSQEPFNLKILSDNNINFAITTDGLKSLKSLKSNLIKAINHGFDKTKALESLTTIPANLLGKQHEIGSLKQGYLANFIITSGDIFEEKSTLYENWVQGKKYVVNDFTVKDIRGAYLLTLNNEEYKLKIDGELTKLKSDITKDSIKFTSNLSYKDGWISILITNKEKDQTTFSRITGLVSDVSNLNGEAILSNGNKVAWSANKTDDFKEKSEKKVEISVPKLFPITHPNTAFGSIEKPIQETLLIKNTTLWTNEKEGILKNVDILLKKGKIAQIGNNLTDATAKVIDGTGKHVTPGIIDEHSHIGASGGINEGGHNASSEVSLQDVINSEDINIYRNLAGGVTISQILHGSANPIGGQSAILKLKWGVAPDELLYPNQPKFIKFALGENVKQSNFRAANPTRFPQSRMGVEQVYNDYFQRAKEYDLVWKKYNQLSPKEKAKTKAPRYDIELNTIAEILNKERFITCHSYVQSEISMLMNLTEKFGFNVRTFTHILEGYKVADMMKSHGVGGSTFSDWWAYKYEVKDAIPYNGAIMHEQGVMVAFNSDDAEMSRRLNQEAAKAVKYGGVSEEDALKFVTLNPAILLKIDDKVGSLKVGKDADVVLWNEHPLSIYAKPLKTIVDGTLYYDVEKDEKLRQQNFAERNELINLMLQEKNKGNNTQIPQRKQPTQYHCDTLEESINSEHNH
ncbi:MAG: amidohydrolase family protein [Flavobacteriaceae bacterium]|nr:amidohydrolase family protein [Flavobacteriaceae bacterium]